MKIENDEFSLELPNLPDKAAFLIISAILSRQEPETVAATLGSMMTVFLHSHQSNPRDPIKEDKKRREIFDKWTKKVWEHVAVLDAQGETKQ